MEVTKKKPNGAEYSADSIKVLEGLEAVRTRPAMYIGSTGLLGLHHLVYEVVDNSIDEAMAGYCSKIKVIIHFDNSITVIDNGRGIPVDLHKEEGKPAAEVVMTTLHAGGKFDNGSYKVSGGLHGVGVSVVNALSSKLELEIKRDGAVYYQKYKEGVPEIPFKKIGKSNRRGTKITFWPDDEIFEVSEYEFDILSKRMKQLAYLNKGIKITLIDERQEIEEVYKFEGGIVEYVQDIVGSRSKAHEDPVYIYRSDDNLEIEVSFQYVNNYSENIYSFVNNIHTTEGGTHLTGFKGALTRTINNFSRLNNIAKKDFKESFSGEDVREGLNAVISIRISDPQFEGQTKTKLGNSEVKGFVETFVNEKLSDYFEENINVAKAIINKAYLAAKAREASRKAKDLIRKSNLLESTSLPGKLADCQSKDPAESEIFIVEGDSAGGSAKQGRDRKYQAILPLRGKILNVEKTNPVKMLENNEIKTIVSALGVGIGKEHYDIDKLRYHKVIIMTDADVDGAHIRTLIMTFFFRHMRSLIERGHLYLAQPPLYLVRKNKTKTYLKNEKDLENYLYRIIESDVLIEDQDKNVLSNMELVTFVKMLNKKSRLMENIQKRGIPLELISCLIELIEDEDSFNSREKAEQIARELENLECIKVATINFDEEHSTYGIDIEYDHKGVRRLREINWEYLTGPLFAEINEMHELLRRYPYPPFKVKIGQREHTIESREKVVPLLFDFIKKDLYIQRYKGLGEMNPDQLWETTLDRGTRTLLKVDINDLIESDIIFDTLMGSDSSKRKEFIFNNAINVRNLDI